MCPSVDVTVPLPLPESATVSVGEGGGALPTVIMPFASGPVALRDV